MNKRHGMRKGALVAVLLLGLAIPASRAVAQEMGFFPVRVALLGSPPGTPGSPVDVQFNAALDCWELPLLPGGAEVHLDVQVFGWGDAPGNPRLAAFQATADPTGYNNGIGADLNPKGWPDDPGRGHYPTTCLCSDNEVPCVPPFDATCDGGSAGVCVYNPDFINVPDPPFELSDPRAPPLTLSLGYTWFGLMPNIVDEGRITTVAGLILEVPADAAGTYVVGLDPDINASSMLAPSGAPIPVLQFTSTCITIVEEIPCCLPDGSVQLLPEDCALGSGIVACECRGDDDVNGVDDACEADCDGDGTLDIVELADCPPEDLSCADCNNNCEPDGCEPDADGDGVPNECDNCPDAPNPGQEDQNGDGLGDVCAGACCFVLNGNFSCLDATEADYAALPGVTGVFQGLGTVCPTENVGTQIHLGTVVTHVTVPAQVCGGGGRAADCIPGDPIDPWQTAVDAVMCHQFDAGPESPPIPADFFGPGSDPFTGQVCLEGEPLGPTPFGEFGDADTLVRRTGGPAGTGDPVDRCELPAANDITVDAEVVALSLVSTDPIIVTYNGGQDPESWDVAVDLSVVTPPPGTITAVKSHCNGGTYNSELHVQPRFTFSEVGGSGTGVLDTGLEGIPFVTLFQDDDPHWTSDVSETLGLASPICTDFHPGIEDTEPTADCDCNDNEIRDVCDVESPLPALPPHDILKNRYISIDPRGADQLNICNDFDLRLTLTGTFVNGAPTGGVYWAGQPDANCISQVTPTKPIAAPNWDACPTAHLTGCPIIPTSTYDIVVVVGPTESAALFADTQALPTGTPGKWWGDVVGQFDPVADAWGPPNGFSGIDDAVAAIKTFQNPALIGPGCGTPPCNATHVSVTDVHPGGFPLEPFGTPNKKVDINDVFAIILGFQGNEFPGPQIDLCP